LNEPEGGEPRQGRLDVQEEGQQEEAHRAEAAFFSP
jgi:hypothetical protein